jgi:hypothetical protein
VRIDHDVLVGSAFDAARAEERELAVQRLRREFELTRNIVAALDEEAAESAEALASRPWPLRQHIRD